MPCPSFEAEIEREKREKLVKVFSEDTKAAKGIFKLSNSATGGERDSEKPKFSRD